MGRRFATGIRDQLTAWRGDPVTIQAELLAAEMRTEHRTRWRLNHLRPAMASVEALAHDWLSDTLGERAATTRVTALESGATTLGQARAYLMELRYRDPERIRWLMEGSGGSTAPRILLAIDEADTALLRGDYVTASRCYIKRLKTANDNDAWIGLAIVLPREGSAASSWLLAEQPELVAAVHVYLRALRDQAPDVNGLIDWLAGRLMTSGTAE
jgi:hypothetical protein